MDNLLPHPNHNQFGIPFKNEYSDNTSSIRPQNEILNRMEIPKNPSNGQVFENIFPSGNPNDFMNGNINTMETAADNKQRQYSEAMERYMNLFINFDSEKDLDNCFEFYENSAVLTGQMTYTEAPHIYTTIFDENPKNQLDVQTLSQMTSKMHSFKGINNLSFGENPLDLLTRMIYKGRNQKEVWELRNLISNFPIFFPKEGGKFFQQREVNKKVEKDSINMEENKSSKEEMIEAPKKESPKKESPKKENEEEKKENVPKKKEHSALREKRRRPSPKRRIGGTINNNLKGGKIKVLKRKAMAKKGNIIINKSAQHKKADGHRHK